MPPKRNAECATVAKPKAISKSKARKPLRDVSNAGKVSSKSAAKKLPFKIGEEDDHPPQAASDSNTAVDRLILIHSDISSLFRQIDELVVEALKFTSKEGMKEIKSFADFLSQMETSLKPWVPRFQRVLSVERVNQLEHPVVCRQDESTMEDIIHESPEQTKWDSLVSPSPLVSWRGGCTAEGGRQLFLLTPLPRRKALSVKYQEPSKSALDASALSSVAQLPSVLDAVGDTKDDLHEGVVVKYTPIKVSDRTLESNCVSPPNLFRRDGCLLVMTPCLKVSPPKSCVILEPLAEVPQKNSLAVHRSTPFPKGILESDNSQDSESSTFHGSEKMSLKYPQLLGIKLGNNYGNRMKGIEESLNWLMSPPKTCVLMEPPEENLWTHDQREQVLSAVGSNLIYEANQISRNQNGLENGRSLANTTCEQGLCSSFRMVESTPMPREPESTIRFGKRRPGENTLKKELWTKFEAASVSGVRFNFTAMGESDRKGFLDRLEEEAP